MPTYFNQSYIPDFNALDAKEVEQIQFDMMRFMTQAESKYDDDMLNQNKTVEDIFQDYWKTKKQIRDEVLNSAIKALNKNITAIQTRLEREGIIDNSHNFTDKVKKAYEDWTKATIQQLKDFKKISAEEYSMPTFQIVTKQIQKAVQKTSQQAQIGDPISSDVIKLIVNKRISDTLGDAVQINNITKTKSGKDIILKIKTNAATKKEIFKPDTSYKRGQNKYEFVLITESDDNGNLEITFSPTPKASPILEDYIQEYTNNFMNNLQATTTIKEEKWMYNGNYYDTQIIAAFYANPQVQNLMNSEYSKYFDLASKSINNGRISLGSIETVSGMTGGFGEWYWLAFFHFLNDQLNTHFGNTRNFIHAVGVDLKAQLDDGKVGEVPVDLIYAGIAAQAKNYSESNLGIYGLKNPVSDMTRDKWIKEYGSDYDDWIIRTKDKEGKETINKVQSLGRVLKNYGLGGFGFGDIAITIIGNFLVSRTVNQPNEELAGNEAYSNYKNNIYSRFKDIYEIFRDVFIPSHANAALSLDKDLAIELTQDAKTTYKTQLSGHVYNDIKLALSPSLPDLFATKNGIYRVDEPLIAMRDTLQDIKNNTTDYVIRPQGLISVDNVEINILPFEQIGDRYGVPHVYPKNQRDTGKSYDIPHLMDSSLIRYTIRFNLSYLKSSPEGKSEREKTLDRRRAKRNKE